MHAAIFTGIDGGSIFELGAHFAALSESTRPEHPALLQRGEGPFRDFDLIAIGWVLIAVLVIHAVRKFSPRRGEIAARMVLSRN